MNRSPFAGLLITRRLRGDGLGDSRFRGNDGKGGNDEKAGMTKGAGMTKFLSPAHSPRPLVAAGAGNQSQSINSGGRCFLAYAR
ncbi:MAG: hypothetical protein ACR2P4_06305 [Gammaproteobacteria bacterium]